ncbi:MAG: ABC transporter ATP-binding protein [Oscillospiraceae bacterium]|nr:ABC transporter ATP-binding protein [Oscillospiraceae bacterium]
MSEITPDIREDKLTENAEETRAEEAKEKTEETQAEETKEKTEKDASKPKNKAAGAKKKNDDPDKPKNAKKTARRLFAYMAKSKKVLILVIVLVLVSSLISVATYAINEPVVNLCKEVITEAGRARISRSEFIRQLGLWLGLMFGLSIVSAVASYAYQRIMLQVSQKTMLVIRKDLFDHLQTLPISYFDTNKNGDIMSRFSADVETVSDIIQNGMTNILQSLTSLVGTVALMIIYSPLITLTLFLSVIFIVFIVMVIAMLSAKQFQKYQKAMGDCNGYIEEYIRGQRVVKIFSYEERSKAEFKGLAMYLKKVGIGANTITGLLSPIMSFISKINYAVCALLGVILLIKSGGRKMNVGRLVAFLSCAKSFTSPITSIASQFTSLMSALAGAERIFEVIDMSPELDEGKVTMVKAVKNADGKYTECDDNGWIYVWKMPLREGEYIYTPVMGDVKFENVTFGYNEDKVVLNNISLEAKPGEKIAFVGSTGAGKTTVTNLINRFYDIDKGSITIDGIDIKAIKKDDLRSSMSMVLQDTHLFSGTVADNIRYGRLDASDEEVVEAAKIASADSFITRLPNGYQTDISSDGKNLSQGQRQLISIARAAVANPTILILDEATSSIDTRTEQLIEKGMDKLMEGRTVFVIAHRLSTVRNSDDIKVLENGEIIESGNHDELIAREGKYYKLYNGLYELT